MSIDSHPLPLDGGDRAVRTRIHRARDSRTLDVAPETSALRNRFVLVVVLGWAAFVYAAYVLGLR
jgi:hypothetical protein